MIQPQGPLSTPNHIACNERQVDVLEGSIVRQKKKIQADQLDLCCGYNDGTSQILYAAYCLFIGQLPVVESARLWLQFLASKCEQKKKWLFVVFQWLMINQGVSI